MKIFESLKYLLTVGLIVCGVSIVSAAGKSVYTQRPDDSEAFYFTPEKYGIKADGRTDVTAQLQSAVNELKREKNFGILFIPEGKYLISNTIHIPPSIRLIGYGKKRPVICLADNTPGYDKERKYMVWFTGGIARDGQEPSDANAGTFYSALSNIDFSIGKGNPEVVAVRSHYAQHCFISHCDFNIGQGMAGIHEVGNELEDVNFYGGQYGIISGRCSPGWPMMMVDTYFEGHKKAAIRSSEAGFAIVGMQVRNTPVVVEMAENVPDRLMVENALWENISEAAVKIGVADNTFSQLNMVGVDCRNVPVLVEYPDGKKVAPDERIYKVKDFVYGFVYDNLAAKSEFREICDIEPLAKIPSVLPKVLPQLPPMETWVNLRDLGAKGDGTTDDTEIIRKAIETYDNIYVPQGWYRVSGTVKMRPGTRLIGLHPFGTQFTLAESTPAFSGFGTPVPVIESSKGGDDVLNGIGINTGAYNYRAVGCKWMAGKDSYINDVKFVGGHGTLHKPVPGEQPRQWRRPEPRISSPDAPVTEQGKDLAWDTQYWSLWITDGGGGTVKDVWTANSYASSGLYISDTDTPGRIYAMSLEHHVRSEARFNNAANWKIYAFQFEEEGREGPDEYMVEMSGSRNIELNNVWMYRVIRAYMPKKIGFRIWDCADITFRNMHNYTQILPVIEYPVYDMNKDLPVYSWDFARLKITGKEPARRRGREISSRPMRLAEGFELATGATSDSKGNVYFCENRLKKIYKWDAATGKITLIADFPWKPFSLATDTDDRLIVICRYDPQPGYKVNGEQETAPVLPDDNPWYSGWGNGGWSALAYAFDPEHPDATMTVLPRCKTSEAKGVGRVILPAHRWRGDYEKVVASMPENSFVAPDGRTIIPETYDLGRSCSLFDVKPGQKDPAYVANEINKTTIRYTVQPDGRLSDPVTIAPFGQYCSVTDANSNVYVADGEIFVLDRDGNEIRRIQTPERPISMAIGGADKNILFITSNSSVYAVRI